MMDSIAAFQCMQYAPDIVKAVENGVKPDETCQKIGLCSSLSGRVLQLLAQLFCL